MESSKLTKRKLKRMKTKRKEEETIDEDIQRQLLDKLDAYGDSLLEHSPLRQKNRPRIVQNIAKNSSTVGADPEENGAESCPGNVSMTRTETEGDIVISKKSRKRKKKWEIELEEELKNFSEDSFAARTELTSQRDGNISTKRRKEPELVVFEERPRSNKDSGKISPVEDDNVIVPSKKHLLQISNEVYQFGLSGFKFQDKEKLEMERAVKLGAKPPKRSNVPYKEFMQQQKDKKVAELKQREIDRKLGFKVPKKSRPGDDRERVIRKCAFWKDPTKDRNFFIDGQIGKFRGGVQILSKEDIYQTKKKIGRRTKNKRF